MIEQEYLSDIEEILSHRYDNGWDLWTTPDKRILKGSPFSTLGSAQLLLELGMSPKEKILQEVAELIFDTWQEDGRFKVYPKGTIYPCQTAHSVNLLCQMGYGNEKRVEKTFQHLLEIQEEDGGWRCKKFSFGKGEETNYSNPFPTLIILHAFRFNPIFSQREELNKGVEFLLEHWRIRKPIGPCHYGMGKLFMEVEYPFGNYNLFIYVYVLSFYKEARKDPRFLEAFHILESKTQNGKLLVERISPKLKNLKFCKKGEISVLGTKRYQEILKNLEKD